MSKRIGAAMAALALAGLLLPLLAGPAGRMRTPRWAGRWPGGPDPSAPFEPASGVQPATDQSKMGRPHRRGQACQRDDQL